MREFVRIVWVVEVCDKEDICLVLKECKNWWRIRVWKDCMDVKMRKWEWMKVVGCLGDSERIRYENGFGR